MCASPVPLRGGHGLTDLDPLLTAARYCHHLDVDHRAALLSEETAKYMNFFDWMARTSRKKKKRTYITYWEGLSVYYSLLARRQMPDDILKQMRRVYLSIFPAGIVVADRHQYLNTRLRADHGVSVRSKPKHTMSPEDLGVLLRQLWLYTGLAPLGRQILQMAFVLLCCSFTGTRPRILVPPASTDSTSPEDSEAGKDAKEEPSLSKRDGESGDDFRSDIPRHIRYDELPRYLCYRDIDLFVIRNPEGDSDIVVAVVDFRNLKGTEQGTEG